MGDADGQSQYAITYFEILSGDCEFDPTYNIYILFI